MTRSELVQRVLALYPHLTSSQAEKSVGIVLEEIAQNVHVEFSPQDQAVMSACKILDQKIEIFDNNTFIVFCIRSIDSISLAKKFLDLMEECSFQYEIENKNLKDSEIVTIDDRPNDWLNQIERTFIKEKYKGSIVEAF